MKNIAVAGTGYVGLSTGTCFADLGNNVTCIDINEEKIEMLRQGNVPIYEPGLSEMMTRNVKAGRLHFTTDYDQALADAEFVFICVGTPSGVDGEADLRYVRMAAESIAKTMTHPLIIVNKSTVPVGTGDWVADIVIRSQPEAGRLRRGELPRIHARGIRDPRLYESRPGCVSAARTRMPLRRWPNSTSRCARGSSSPICVRQR